MQPTVRLFDEDAYATEFDARVLQCEKKDEYYEVVLDRTLFFPEEGGQSPDQGTLLDCEVCHVSIENEVITHHLKEPLEVGKIVHGSVEWEHRFWNMQQHTGEHIFSGTVYSLFGFSNVGFHLSDQIVTMDFDGVLTPDDVERVEWIVNEAISKNVEVETFYPSKEELEKIEYRSKKELTGDVRIVRIPGYDICACCAPHVQRTGEIGFLKVQSVQNYKGGVRISMLCGFRALLACRDNARLVQQLMNVMTTGTENLVETVEKQKNALQTTRASLINAKQELLLLRCREVDSKKEDVFLFEKDLEDAVLRTGVNTLMETHLGFCGIFSGDEKAGYHFIIGSRKKDCREIAAVLKECLSARGGGRETMIQGSVNAPREKIERILKADINA